MWKTRQEAGSQYARGSPLHTLRPCHECLHQMWTMHAALVVHTLEPTSTRVSTAHNDSLRTLQMIHSCEVLKKAYRTHFIDVCSNTVVTLKEVVLFLNLKLARPAKYKLPLILPGITRTRITNNNITESFKRALTFLEPHISSSTSQLLYNRV